MKRVLSIGKWLLLAWGGFSLLGAVVIAGFVAYSVGVANRTKTDSTSPRDVRFVLNWCRLGEDRIESVVRSYESSRSFTGDHLDAYAIRVKHLTVEELTASTDEFRGRWYRGDQLPKVLDDTISFVGGWLHEIAWFPMEDELRSSDVYIYPWSIRLHGVQPSATQLIFARPKDGMIFYFSGKT